MLYPNTGVYEKLLKAPNRLVLILRNIPQNYPQPKRKILKMQVKKNCRSSFPGGSQKTY